MRNTFIEWSQSRGMVSYIFDNSTSLTSCINILFETFLHNHINNVCTTMHVNMISIQSQRFQVISLFQRYLIALLFCVALSTFDEIIRVSPQLLKQSSIVLAKFFPMWLKTWQKFITFFRNFQPLSMKCSIKLIYVILCNEFHVFVVR